jgi:glycosyltransferase involved in cell wall biosynthesis
VTRVAFHTDQVFYRVPGGIGTYVRELVPALRAADPDLEITLFHARFDRPPEPWMRAFPLVGLGTRIRMLYPGWALAGRPALPRSLASVDVIHAPSPAAVPPARRGQRLVVTVHDLAFLVHPELFPPAWRAIFRLGLRRAARTADTILAPSRSTALDLSRLAGVAADRVRVAPLAATLPEMGTDPQEVLGRLRVPRPYALFVGTLEPRKNLVRLVRAYRRAVASSDLPHALVLAGPMGWRAAPLQRELRTPGPGNVVLSGHATPDLLDALYRGADAFLYPSLYEGFGLPVVEAMARGVPTVVSTSSSLPEVAGQAALSADPRSVPQLADAIARVLTDAGEARRLGEAGRERARRFTWDRTARRTLEAYSGDHIAPEGEE